MNMIERDIYVLADRTPVSAPIDYVQGTNLIPIKFNIVDYDLPDGATAKVYVKKPSTKAEFDTATIDGNSVIIDVKDSMFSETGTSSIQVLIAKESDTLVTFEYPVRVGRNNVAGELPESENRSNFLDDYIGRINQRIDDTEERLGQSLEEVVAAKNTAIENANITINKVEETEADRQETEQNAAVAKSYAEQARKLVESVPPWAKQPAPDKSLEMEGQAADSKAVGDVRRQVSGLKGDIGELKNVVGITEKQKIEWESGRVEATSDGFAYYGGSNYIRTKDPIKLKSGDSVSITDNTTYGFSLKYIAVDGTYGNIAHSDWNPKIAQVDGNYHIVVYTRDASSLVNKVQEVANLITIDTIRPLTGILGDIENLSGIVNEKQDTLIAGDGIHIAEDGKTISAVGVSDGNSILLSNILNPQSIVAEGGSVASDNGIYTITANGTMSEPKLAFRQAYEANHKYMLIASVRCDYSEHKPVSMFSRVEEGSVNHFSEWVNSKNIPAANVSLDCRNCYHIFEISTSGSYRTSFTVNFGTEDNANGAVFKISNIALIDVTDMDVNYRLFAKAIHAQLNGVVEENSSVELDMTLHYPIQNCNIAFFGDSILGNYSEHEKLAVMSKANVYNFAFGGTTVTNGNALSLCNLIDAKRSGDFTAQDAVIGGNVNRLSMLKNFDFASLDYIVIEIGTNDWRQAYLTIGDDDSTDLKTIKGAYNHVLETIYAINPMVKVFILTPLYRTQFDANTTPNAYSGIYLYQVVDAIKEIANNWGVPVYDMYHNSGVNVANSTVYLLDGTHPTPVMEYRIVDIIYNLITQYIN